VPPLSAARCLTTWSLDVPVTVALVVAAAGYLWARGRVPGWPAARLTAFLLGLAGVLAVKTSFLAAYDHTLFWVLAVQDVLLLTLVPFALVLGRPVMLLRLALGRPATTRRSLSPLLGSLMAMVVLLTLYTTGWDESRLHHGLVFELTHVTLVLAGCAFLGPLLSEGGTSYGVRTLVAFVDGLFDAVPGLAVLGSHGLIAGSWYVGQRRSWGPSPAHDQQIGGAAMIALSELVGLPAMLLLLVRWVRADAVEAAAVDAELDVVAAAESAAAGGEVLQRPWWETDPVPRVRRATADRWRGD
jgi:cytochrome c oxidase assembly factor CtaG